MDRESLEKRPGILVVGTPNVGKRTLISRLISIDFGNASDSLSELFVYGWTINTKYYTADTSIWMVQLHDELSVMNLPFVDRIVALVMVFDVSDPLSFTAIQDWVSNNDIRKFDILLCVGNKVDLLPRHPAHISYKRRLLKNTESSASSHPEFSSFGISDTDGSSLLGDENSSMGMKSSYFEWCLEHNIEYVEACASSADFDKCLSVDGDLQGVERLHGAVSAHMWPGMLLKSGDKINEPSFLEKEESSEEESDYEQEYEILSPGSVEPWDYVDEEFVSAYASVSSSEIGKPPGLDHSLDRESGVILLGNSCQSSATVSQLPEEFDTKEAPAQEAERNFVPDMGRLEEFEGLESLMGEIGNIRSNLRLMPDFQRREMAAKLAMRMAEMFGDVSDGEDAIEYQIKP